MRRVVLVVVAMFMSGCGGCSHSSSHNPDAGMNPPDGGATEMLCETLPPAQSGTCDFTAGSSTTLIKGNILTPTTMYRGGQVAVDATGKIACVGCKCAQGGETTLTCGDGVVSPG